MSPIAPKRWVLMTVITTALVVVMVLFCDTKSIAACVSRLSPSGVILLVGLYLFTQLLRALRYHVLLQPRNKGAISTLGAVVLVHQLGNHILPFRLGELTFPFLCNRHTEIATSKATAALLIVRIQEIYVLGLIFVIALLIRTPAAQPEAILWLVLTGLVLLAGGVMTEFFLKPLLDITQRWLGKLSHRVSNRRVKAQLETASDFLTKTALASTQRGSLRRQGLGLALTIAIWLTMFTLFHATMHMLGNEVDVASTVIGSSFANVSQLLPINTLGSLGSLEVGWVLGFSLVGVEPQAAFASSVVLHSVVLLCLLFAGAIALLFLQTKKRE